MGRLMAPRTDSTRALYVRIPNDVYARLQTQAARRHMTLTLLANVLLVQGLDRIGDDPVEIPVHSANPDR